MGEVCVQYEKQVLCLYLRSIYGVYQQLLTIINSFFSSRGNFSLYFNDTCLNFRHYPRFELSLFSDLACFLLRTLFTRVTTLFLHLLLYWRVI